jgi:hypothetical protein
MTRKTREAILRCAVFIVVGVTVSRVSGWAASAEGRDGTKLTVAIFAWLPDAAAALEKLEEGFEAAHQPIDLELELWDPYKDTVADDGLEQIQRFDVVEIDICRLPELIDGAFGGLDMMPPGLRGEAGRYVEAAQALVAGTQGAYVAPHWVCGDFLVFWAGNQALAAAGTLSEILDALDPAQGRPLLADLCGSSTLGALYADAVLDLRGAEFARAHLEQLTMGAAQLDEEAATAVARLASELPTRFREHLEHYHDLNWVYPRHFADTPGGALLGYSERLYHAQRELQLDPDRKLPIIRAEEVVVRPLPFGATSQGTPCWLDGFVIPHGKLGPKRRAITSFVRFALSEKGYLAFIEPTAYQPSTYLLPAHSNGYSEAIVKRQPAINGYRDALDDALLIDGWRLWQGVRTAGGALEKRIVGDGQ